MWTDTNVPFRRKIGETIVSKDMNFTAFCSVICDEIRIPLTSCFDGQATVFIDRMFTQLLTGDVGVPIVACSLRESLLLVLPQGDSDGGMKWRPPGRRVQQD